MSNEIEEYVSEVKSPEQVAADEDRNPVDQIEDYHQTHPTKSNEPSESPAPALVVEDPDDDPDDNPSDGSGEPPQE